MTSDKLKQAKSELLRELENLRAQLDDPASATISEEEIPLLLDKVDRAVSSTPDLNRLLDEGLDPGEVEVLRKAYQQATNELQASEARLLEKAFPGLREGKRAAAPQRERLPGQQSLFEPADTEPQAPEQPPLRPKALGENPFLPKHIRDRLEERRKALADHIAEAATFFPGSEKPSASARASKDVDQALIDELVAEYLPRIETELRHRLMRKLHEIHDEDGSTDQS